MRTPLDTLCVKIYMLVYKIHKNIKHQKEREREHARLLLSDAMIFIWSFDRRLMRSVLLLNGCYGCCGGAAEHVFGGRFVWNNKQRLWWWFVTSSSGVFISLMGPARMEYQIRSRCRLNGVFFVFSLSSRRKREQ